MRSVRVTYLLHLTAVAGTFLMSSAVYSAALMLMCMHTSGNCAHEPWGHFVSRDVCGGRVCSDLHAPYCMPSFNVCVMNQNGKLFMWRACVPQVYERHVHFALHSLFAECLQSQKHTHTSLWR